MKTIEIKLYKFEELSEDAKENAIREMSDINTFCNWWEFVCEDAKQIGLLIDSFDLGGKRDITGQLLWSMQESCEAIMKEHGTSCDTYKLAESYIEQIKELSSIEEEDEQEDAIDDLTTEFQYELLQEYLSILDREYWWRLEDEQIIESIISNDFHFTEDGKLY